jgi:hypothetical protein
MWFRIFSTNDVEPDHAAILEYLNRIDEVRGLFRGDDAGWFHADLTCRDVTLSLDRYTADEEGVRAELNTWAAVIESQSSGEEHTRLMEQLIQTRQLFTLQVPDAGIGGLLSAALCGYLARVTDGIFQMDGEGFFARDGTRLWRET